MDKIYIVCILVFINWGCQDLSRDCLEQDCHHLGNLLTSNCWQEFESGSSFAGVNHYFCFSEDQTVTLKQEHWSDFGHLVGCPNSRTEYIKGTYEISGNTIQVSGEFYDESYKSQVIACGNQGSFNRQYEVISAQGWQILLRSEDDIDPDIRLKPVHP